VNDKYKDHIESVCMKYFGENKLNECKAKNNFCKMCCNFHIGIKFPDKRLECTGKCDELMGYNSGKVERKKKN
jgi:hypothetical protein